ncbi:hypothetical protein BDZ91DRAFT_779790 [Kalaharituber pfeilii]|nr:hypothetical protein BDZ91DRAFT_779790 [Kalaharituber pfeilii]
MAQQPGTRAQKPGGRENLVNAVDAFNQSLSPDQRNILSQTKTPSDILELTKTLQDAKVSEKKIKRCEAFLQSVQQFSGIVDTMIQHNACISALIWGSVKILLLTAQNFAPYFSSLTEFLEKLGMFCPIFKEFQDLWPHYQGLQDAVFEYYAQTVQFCTDALAFLRRSNTSMILRALLQPLHNELQDVEKRLTIQQKIVDYQIKLASEDARRKAIQQQMLFNANWEEHRNIELQELTRNRESLQRLEASTKGNSKRQLQQWRKTSERVLQLEVKQEAQKRFEERQRQLRRISDYNHTITFLEIASDSHPRTGEWLYQMSEYKEWVQACHSSVLWCYGIPGSGKSVLSTAVVKHLLHTCIQHTNSQTEKSRPEIEGYIDESLRKRLHDGRLRIHDPGMIEEIKQALMGGAEGMQLNDEEIRETLRSLPRNLDETYIRMLQRIVKERKKDIAVEAFRWLITARRQLSLRELVEAVVIKDDDNTRTQGLNRIPTDLDKIIEACGTFLVVEEPICDSSHVRFIHSTVITFLHTYELPAPLEVFQIEPQTAELHLAKRCLQYLHFQDLQTQMERAIPVSASKPRQSILSMPVSKWIPTELQSGLVSAASRQVLKQPSREHVPKRANLKVFSPPSDSGPGEQMNKSGLFQYIIENWLNHCQGLPMIRFELQMTLITNALDGQFSTHMRL